MPPCIRLGKRADGGTGKTAPPLIVHIRPELVASEPIDLVFFNSVKDDLIAKGNTVGWTGIGAFAANFAEIIHAIINGLVRYQRQVGHDRVRHVDARAEMLVDDETVASELAHSGGDACSLRSHHTAQRRVAEFLDVAFQRFENHVALDLRHMIGGIADEVPVGL